MEVESIKIKTEEVVLDLDNRQICFLCLEEGQYEKVLFRLGRLSQFMGVNLKERIKETISNSAEDWSDVAVHLCEECGEKAVKLEAAYERREVVKRKLDEAVGTINEVVAGSSNDLERVEEAKKIMMEDAEKLRRTALKKRKLEGETSNPSAEEVKKNLKPNPVCRFCLNPIDRLIVTQQVILRHEVNHHLHEVLESHRLSHVSVDDFKKIVYYLFPQYITRGRSSNPIPGKEAKEVCKCPHCPKEYIVGMGGVATMSMHIISSHAENVAQRLKELQSNLSESMEKLANQEFLGETCVCSCFLPSMIIALKHRAAYECFGKGNRRLREERLFHREPTWLSYCSKCTLCKATFEDVKFHKNGRCMKKHLVTHHLDKFFGMKLKSPSLTPLQFKMVVYHLLIDVKKQRVEELPGGRRQVWCPYCHWKTIYKGRFLPITFFKIHILEKHREDLKTKLLRLQREPDLAKRLEQFVGTVCKCGDYMPTKQIYSIHKRKSFCPVLDDPFEAVEGVASDSELDDGSRSQGEDDDQEDSSNLSVQVPSDSRNENDVLGSLLKALCKSCGMRMGVEDIPAHKLTCPSFRLKQEVDPEGESKGLSEGDGEENGDGEDDDDFVPTSDRNYFSGSDDDDDDEDDDFLD